MKRLYSKNTIRNVLPNATLVMASLLLLMSFQVQAQLSNSYIQNQVSQYQQANFWINGYARVGGADGTYKNYLKSVVYTSNAYSGAVLESNGSVNYGITGAFAPGFRFRWLAHNNGAINYAVDNDVIMDLRSSGTLVVKARIIVGKTSQVNPTYKLDVAGAARADKMVVNTSGADYVFDSTYQLRTLESLEDYIQTNHHLPGVTTAPVMQKEGLDVGENQTTLLMKIEELTLYIIKQQHEIDDLKSWMNKERQK